MISINYDFNVSPAAIALMGVALAGLLYILTVYLWRQRIVRRQRKRCDQPSDDILLGLPGTSVIVYASGEGSTLADNLPLILQQRFEGYFEVIVVNDGADPDTEMAVTRLQNDYPNLYMTFSPAEVRNLSRKKLALTLGIKAAKGEVIVVTDASTRVGSDTWLYDMVMPFADPAIKVVIGYNAPVRGEDRTHASKTALFDAVEDAVTWLGAAIGGHAYRATATNMAFSRDLFLTHKGFSQSLNFVGGADDIFIYEISDKSNTYVQLSSASIGVEGCGHNMRRRLRYDRVTHAFTGLKLPKGPRRLMALGEWLMWIVPCAALVGAYLCGVTNVVGWAAAAVIILAMEISVVMSWRKTLLALGAPRMGWRLLWTVPLRPVRNILTGISARWGDTPKYSWEFGPRKAK